MKKVVVLDKETVFDRFFRIEEARLSFERFDGEMSPEVRRLSFERGDSVAAVIYNLDTRRLLLVNQFKYPTLAKGPGWITELMAGMVGDSEEPEQAVRREILEETGYQAAALERISTFYVSPGGSSERIVLYYAEVRSSGKVEAGGGAADENEDIRTVEYTIEEAVAAVAEGEIVDAKTIIGVYWLRDRLGGTD